MNELDEDGGEPAQSASPIIVVGSEPVMLASRVAQAFEVETREIIQAIKRNPTKFNENHAFELTADDVAALTSQGVISKPGRGGSRARPWVVTHKGVVRLATVMNSSAAVAATDRIIDVFIQVQTQLAQGRTDLIISNSSQILPDPDAVNRHASFRDKLYKALEGLLGTIIDRETKTTVRDQLEDTGDSALNYLKSHLRKQGLENEKVTAETLHILEKVRELRARTEADIRKSTAETEKIVLENLDKKIGIVERLLLMADKIEPNAVVSLVAQFPPTAARLQPRRQQLPFPTHAETTDQSEEGG